MSLFSVFAQYPVEAGASVYYSNKYLFAYLEACTGHNTEETQLRNREETLQK